MQVLLFGLFYLGVGENAHWVDVGHIEEAAEGQAAAHIGVVQEGLFDQTFRFADLFRRGFAAGDLHFADMVLFHFMPRGLRALAECLDHSGGVFPARASVENSDFHCLIPSFPSAAWPLAI